MKVLDLTALKVCCKTAKQQVCSKLFYTRKCRQPKQYIIIIIDEYCTDSKFKDNSCTILWKLEICEFNKMVGSAVGNNESLFSCHVYYRYAVMANNN